MEQADVHDARAALAAGVVQRGAPVGRLSVEKRGGRGLAVQLGMVGAVRLPPELGGADGGDDVGEAQLDTASR